MVFSTPVFLFLFLPAVLGATLLLPKAARNLLLLLASLLFYAWGEQEIVLAMVASIAINWFMGLVVSRGRTAGSRKAGVAVAVVSNLGLLVYFKYANFFAGNLGALMVRLGGEPWEVAPIALPIGISFFTFQAMSYVIDVYRGEGEPQKNPVNFALYIAMFPQLIAGPIVRYRDIAGQLKERTVDSELFASGIRRFVVGLGKKMLVANTVAKAADEIFAVDPGQVTTGMAWLAMACYTLQIYFDFSGYSDMAIGLGRMFGFRFLENFNYPYISRTITEFWRRWHISLSSWFRDYLYIPLGGNRGAPWKTYRNLVMVFLLCGLWHGAAWNFMVWGLYHGVFLVIERLGLRALLERLPRPVRHVYALLVVIGGWVFFRAEDMPSALAMLSAMAGAGGPTGLEQHVGLYLDATVATALVAGALGSTPWLPALARWRAERVRARPGGGRWLDAGLELGAFASLLLILLGCSSLMAAGTHNPFIYFRF